MRPVCNKSDFVRRYQNGEFGNASISWPSVAAWVEADEQQGGERDKNLYHMRNRIAGGPTMYNLHRNELKRFSQAPWAQRPNWYVSMMAPHDETVIQGELRLAPCGLEVFYSDTREPMRPSLLSPRARTVQGLTAVGLLRRSMDPGSFDWVQELLVNYPGHTIEFSVFRRPWGTLAGLGYRTVIWEVRFY
jgi:hypothetical protein